MSFGISSRLALAALLLGYAGMVAGAQAQAQDSSTTSVADAAKRAREQKRNARSAAKVITDDDLDVDAKKFKAGDEGLTVATPELDTTAPSASAVAAQVALDEKREDSPADDPLKSTDTAKIAAAKEELARAEEDLKLSQREQALQQDTVYSKPDYQRDSAGKAKLDALQAQIAENQQKVEALRARLAAMEEKHRQKAGAAGGEKPAAPPQQ